MNTEGMKISREQRKIQQAVRIIEKQEQRKKSHPHESKPRKIRKVSHFVRINAGSNQVQNVRSDQQEIGQETNSATGLTPHRDKSQQKEKNKKEDKSYQEIGGQHLNQNYPLNGIDLTQYLTLYDFRQKQKNSKKNEQSIDLQGTQPIPLITNVISLKMVQQVCESMKKMKYSKPPFNKFVLKHLKEQPQEKHNEKTSN